MEKELKGRMGRAQRVVQDTEEPMKSAGVAAWLIWAEDDYHEKDPFFLSVVRLTGRSEYLKNFPDATHDLALFRLVVEESPVANDRESLKVIPPFEFHIQVGATDEQAESLGLHLVLAMLEGLLPAWARCYANGEEIWEKSVHDTLEHIVTGGHYKAVVSA